MRLMSIMSGKDRSISKCGLFESMQFVVLAGVMLVGQVFMITQSSTVPVCAAKI